MKLKKWLATVLAAVMAVGALGAFAACGDKETTTPPGGGGGGGGGGGDDDTAIQYYLVGDGLGVLSVSSWKPENTDESLKFTRDGSTATITGDFYEGDQFQIIHGQKWDGQMGANILSNEGKDAEGNAIFTAAPGGGNTPNIIVAEGQSGKYKLTLTLTSESNYSLNSLTWECLDKYDVVFASWFDTDDTTLISKTVVKKNTTTTALKYEEKLPRFYEFKNWVTKTVTVDGEDETVTEAEADFTQPITEHTSFYARTGEVENEGFTADTVDSWKIKIGEKDVTFKQDPAYTQHNVLVATYEFDEFEEGSAPTFTVTNDTTDHANVKLTCGFASFFTYAEDQYTVKQAGNYKFTLITEVGADSKVTVKEFIFEEILPTYSGLAIVGTFNKDSLGGWIYTEGVNPKMVETGKDTNVFKATITFDEIPEAGKIEIKVATIVKNALDWNQDRWGNVNGNDHNSGGNVEITEAGTYTVTLDKTTNVLSVIKTGDQYYVVGDFTTGWAYVEGTNPQLIETGEGTGIYTCTLTLAEAAEVKVAVVANGAIKWEGKPNWGSQDAAGSCLGGGNVSLDAGTYTVTLNINTNVLTFTPVTE